jgi:hypothetical protein
LVHHSDRGKYSERLAKAIRRRRTTAMAHADG